MDALPVPSYIMSMIVYIVNNELRVQITSNVQDKIFSVTNLNFLIHVLLLPLLLDHILSHIHALKKTARTPCVHLVVFVGGYCL